MRDSSNKIGGDPIFRGLRNGMWPGAFRGTIHQFPSGLRARDAGAKAPSGRIVPATPSRSNVALEDRSANSKGAVMRNMAGRDYAGVAQAVERSPCK